ncbi:hypothetical protein B0H13DRAFT_1889510 [Mycena leptocephala]|nr:hypothetical protein B0H13DRAFT_1889510 [Mycena leptocephala]
MTLAPLLQHFEDTNVAMVLGSEMTECALRVYPSLKIDFIFLAFQCNHRVVHLVDSSTPSDPNCDEAPYESADAYIGVWGPPLPPPDLADTRTGTPPRGERLPLTWHYGKPKFPDSPSSS